MNKEKLYFNKLEDVFVGLDIKGDSGYVNLMTIKHAYFKKIQQELSKEINEKLKNFPDFREELFDKLYSFFKKYFSESGSIYFSYTPLKSKVYEQVYTNDKDVSLFWKTNMLYYVKSDKLWNNLSIDFEKDGVVYKIDFDVSSLEHKKANEKKELIYGVKAVKGREVIFSVSYSSNGTRTKIPEILKSLKDKKVFLEEDSLIKIFRTFEKQNEVDFFINKNAGEFLKEQFDMYLKNYLFDDASDFSEKRLKELKFLKEISYKTIDFVSQFEDELVKVWNKPKFVLNSNYVITFDKIASHKEGFKVIEKILKDKGIKEQEKEWEDLGLGKINSKDILKGKELNKDYEKLPIDTKYFSEDVKWEILGLFDNLDEQLDGWLIHSENYQALNTLKEKFKEKIQTIYIDPPYNTGSDEFIYRDTFRDASWLTFIENRLNSSAGLLKNSGNFCCSINENELYNLKILMDSILGPNNYLSNFIIKVRHEGRILKGDKDVHEVIENLLYYRKTEQHKIKKIERDNTSIEEYVWEVEEGSKPDKTINLGGKKVQIFKPGNYKLIKKKPQEDNLKRINIRGSIRQGNSSGRFYVKYLEPLFEEYRGFLFRVESMGKDKFGDRYFFIPEEDSKRNNGDYFQGIPLDREDVLEIPYPNYFNLVDEFNRTGYEGPNYFGTGKKPEAFVKKFLEISNCNKDNLVLDFFLGSGTTTAVAHKLGRRWLGVEMGEHFNSVVMPRMKKVLSGDKSGISKEKDVNWKGGGFFKYYDLEQYEQTLRRTKYKDSHPFENLDDNSIFKQYVFFKDLKLLDAIKLNYDKNKVDVDFSKLYDNVDIAETLSCIAGENIKKVGKDFVQLENSGKIDYKDIPFKMIKRLVVW